MLKKYFNNAEIQTGSYKMHFLVLMSTFLFYTIKKGITINGVSYERVFEQGFFIVH